MDMLYMPELRPLRQEKEKEFLDLVQTLGIRDYWEEIGCEWVEYEVRCGSA